MLVHRVTVTAPAAGTDRYGTTVKDWENSTAQTNVPAWMHQRSTTETRDGREARVTSWVAFLGPHVEVSAMDRITWDSRTFEVDGDPVVAFAPEGVHHVEVPLRIVRG